MEIFPFSRRPAHSSLMFRISGFLFNRKRPVLTYTNPCVNQYQSFKIRIQTALCQDIRLSCASPQARAENKVRYFARIILSLANSSPLASSNFFKRSSTSSLFFSSPATS